MAGAYSSHSWTAAAITAAPLKKFTREVSLVANDLEGEVELGVFVEVQYSRIGTTSPALDAPGSRWKSATITDAGG